MAEEKFKLIGKTVIREDGYAKVTGEACFADDTNLPGQLMGVMIRLPAAHAVIESIDYSAIKDHPDLVAVCDADDVPAARKIGVVKWDQPVFCNEKIVTPGDVVAMLVGLSDEKLLSLASQVRVKYRELPVVTDPQLALKTNTPLIHPETGSNLICHYPLRKGDIDKGFAESDLILEQTYTTSPVEHAYLETEAVVANLLPGKRGIRITGSIQNPFTTRRLVAAVLGWPLNRVEIEQTTLGGSFGGKDDIMNVLAARAAVGTLKTRRPVKIRYRREESILESYKRHPYIMHYRVGVKNDGTIHAMKVDILADGGAYASMSPFVTWRTVVQATGPYEIPHVWTDVRAVYTNNPYTGAMRGFGSPQPIFAQESLMDEIAVRLNITPDEIRRKNGFREGSVTASGQRLEKHNVNLLTALDRAVQKTDFLNQWKKNSSRPKPEILNKSAGKSLLLNEDEFIQAKDVWQSGIGLAMSYRGCSLGAEGIDAAAAYLSLQPDGSAYLFSGLAENGQGLQTTFSIIAAEVLGMEPYDIHYLDYRTSSIPDSGPTVASRSTIMGGGAVKDAATLVRRRLENFLRTLLNLPDSTLFDFRKGSIYEQKNKKALMTFGELCSRAYGQGLNLAAIGWYPGPKVHWDEATGQGPAYFTYAYGCQVAEVRVNLATGEVYLDRVTAVHDPGTVINRLGAEGQVYGGVIQGAGYALWEEISAENGFIRELNFDQYMIPTSRDLGEILPVFLQGDDSFGPWGAKSLGEPTLELTAAAIANAVCNATGRRSFNLPLNLEEILLRRKLYPEKHARGSHG